MLLENHRKLHTLVGLSSSIQCVVHIAGSEQARVGDVEAVAILSAAIERTVVLQGVQLEELQAKGLSPFDYFYSNVMSSNIIVCIQVIVELIVFAFNDI